MHNTLYKTIALGGTFDHLHAGHQQFLIFASKLARQLVIGVTHPQLTRHKRHASIIQPLRIRMSEIGSFCKKNSISVQLVELQDEYGPTIEPESHIQALAVTEATIQGAKKINELRQHLRLKQLPVHVCPLLKDATGTVIASERIRAGTIFRDGTPTQDILIHNICLNSKAKAYLSKRHGKLVTTTAKRQYICVVGDTTLEFFRAKGWKYSLGVYDLKQKRQPYSSPYLDEIIPDGIAQNPAGYITKNMSEHVIKATAQLQSKTTHDPLHIFVEGEEDLVAPVLVLCLPLGSLIYYGQPGEGIVEMEVSEKLKFEVYHLLQSTQIVT